MSERKGKRAINTALFKTMKVSSKLMLCKSVCKLQECMRMRMKSNVIKSFSRWKYITAYTDRKTLRPDSARSAARLIKRVRRCMILNVRFLKWRNKTIVITNKRKNKSAAAEKILRRQRLHAYFSHWKKGWATTKRLRERFAGKNKFSHQVVKAKCFSGWRRFVAMMGLQHFANICKKGQVSDIYFTSIWELNGACCCCGKRKFGIDVILKKNCGLVKSIDPE